MNLLTQYGVNANLSKLEFVDILSIHPAETLKGLRQSLFCEYTALDISSNDFQDIPLVARRDWLRTDDLRVSHSLEEHEVKRFC